MNWNRIVRMEYNRLYDERKVQISKVWNENRSFIEDSTVTNGQCAWKLEFHAPGQLSIGQMIGAAFFVKERVKLQLVREYVLPSVDLAPRNVAWLHIPHNMPTKALQGNKVNTITPYVEEETVDSGFIDDCELAEVSEDDCDKDLAMDDETFINLVQALIPYQQCSTDDIESVDVNVMTKSLILPDANIFLCISEYFLGKINADDLYEKYKRLTRISSCRPNIDRPMKEALTRDDALTSYHKLFCRKCFTYNCQFHCHENFNFVPKKKVGNFKLLKHNDRPCTNTCYLLENERRENLTVTEIKLGKIMENAAINLKSEWSGAELTMLGALEAVFPNNFCVIAEVICSKTCSQVYKQFQFLDSGPNIRSKKSKRNLRGWRTQAIEKVYEPCNHNGPCTDKEICSCVNCEKFCNCDADCIYRTRMTCNCKSTCTTQACLCVSLFRECDPDSCGCVTCKNVNMQQRLGKKVQVAGSDIHGWGLFVDEDCQKGDFIIEYRGEIITMEESNRRGRMCDIQNSNYMFTLNEKYVIDAMNYGNKVRFANFSRTPNCAAKILRVNGDHRIGIYASQFIQAGEELTFNYNTYDPTSRYNRN